jgi:hypothetical protein
MPHLKLLQPLRYPCQPRYELDGRHDLPPAKASSLLAMEQWG